MAKKYSFLVLSLAAAVALSGCGSSKEKEPESKTIEAAEDTEANTEAVTEAAEVATEAEETEGTEKAVVLDPITPSEYLTANASDYVKLGSYDGLEIIQYTYEITDEMVQDRIQEALYDASTESDVETSEAGDTVYVTLESSIKGAGDAQSEDGSEQAEETFFVVGEEELGPEFDSQITGVSVGDIKEFSISFTDDTWYEEWVDQTVDFKITVTGVTRTTVPEYDDQFLAEYTDYTTKDDYEASIRQDLEEEYLEISYSDAIDALFSAAVDASTFSGYPEELFEICRENELSFYRMFTEEGNTDISDVLELFGVAESDIDSLALAAVNRRLFISAYCEANDITVTKDEYIDYVTENASYYGAADAAEFEEMYTRDSLVMSLYESKVADILYASAKVTEMPYSDEENLTDEDFALEEDTEVSSETESLTEEDVVS